jgi:hypothetical protein
MPSGTEAYYSFDYGNIHFICLDSHDLERKPTGAMAKWLRADLEKAKADWLIAYWHHPPYTKGSHDSDKETDLKEMRQHIMPIIESGGVDVVLTGHSHIYERSMLMDGAYATPTVSENVILDDGDGDPQGDGSYRKSEGINPHQGTVQVVTGHGGAHLGRNGSSPVMKGLSSNTGPYCGCMRRHAHRNDGQSRRRRARSVQHCETRQSGTGPAGLAWQPPEYKSPIPHRKFCDGARRSQGSHCPERHLAIPRGEHPRGQGWTQLDFDPGAWKTGPAGLASDQRTNSGRIWRSSQARHRHFTFARVPPRTGGQGY